MEIIKKQTFSNKSSYNLAETVRDFLIDKCSNVFSNAPKSVRSIAPPTGRNGARWAILDKTLEISMDIYSPYVRVGIDSGNWTIDATYFKHSTEGFQITLTYVETPNYFSIISLKKDNDTVVAGSQTMTLLASSSTYESDEYVYVLDLGEKTLTKTIAGQSMSFGAVPTTGLQPGEVALVNIGYGKFTFNNLYAVTFNGETPPNIDTSMTVTGIGEFVRTKTGYYVKV